MGKKKKENIFHKLLRWFVRTIFGLKYEEKWFGKKDAEQKAIVYKNGVPDDSELIVSPARQIFQRFCDRKIAVFAVFVVIAMFLIVFIGPYFMPKYYDSFTETTQVDLPPTMSFMAVPNEMKNDVKMIDSYGSFTVGLSNAGKVFVWGVTRLGATGLKVDIPDEVKNADIAFVSAGQDHIIAIGKDGKYYGWGSNRFGQYARTDVVLSNPNLIPVPQVVADGQLDVAHIKKVTSGYQASAILMDDGQLYIWGNKQAYANIDKFLGSPIKDDDGKTIGYEPKGGFLDIDFTLNNVVGLDKKQVTVYTGMRGMYNMVRTSINGNQATKINEYLNGRKINEIRATSKNVCILLDDGTIALTGDFLSDSTEMPVLEGDEHFVDIEAGTYHYTGVTNKGNVYSFGGDHYYQTKVPDKVHGAAKVFAGAFQSYAVDSNNKLIDSWGLKGYLFGTDDRGANIAERVIAGGKVTMTVGAVAVIIEIIIGVSVGLLSGYFGGWLDILLMRIAEVFSSIPLFPFMLILSSLLSQVALTQNQRLYMIMVILGVLGWPGFAYITRAQILVARESEYVTAAQSMGVKETRIAFKHILPNIISVILVNMTLSFAASMQTETSLSFLGFGVNYPQPSWGNMLTRASNATAAINFWWQWLFTSGILVLTTVCINTIGDTLRDVMDPKSSNDK